MSAIIFGLIPKYCSPALTTNCWGVADEGNSTLLTRLSIKYMPTSKGDNLLVTLSFSK